jgi:hypothetical protein
VHVWNSACENASTFCIHYCVARAEAEKIEAAETAGGGVSRAATAAPIEQVVLVSDGWTSLALPAWVAASALPIAVLLKASLTA